MVSHGREAKLLGFFKRVEKRNSFFTVVAAGFFYLLSSIAHDVTFCVTKYNSFPLQILVQLPVDGCLLRVVNYQLSIINSPFSIINYPLSIINIRHIGFDAFVEFGGFIAIADNEGEVDMLATR
jgi:hypothetical protein